MTLYAKNLGDTGRRVKFKDKQGRWPKLLWKDGHCLVLPCHINAGLIVSNIGNILDVKQRMPGFL